MTQLCVALDSSDWGTLLELADATKAHVDLFKVGLTAHAGVGPAIVEELAPIKPVFLDLKLHDIPVQVEGAVHGAVRSGASYLTVHASGGEEMIKAAVAAADDVKILAVTVLTSLDAHAIDRIGLTGPVTDAVLRLADVAVGAGVDGLVCSPLEVAALRERFPDVALVVPGIRPSHVGAGDQKRVMDPAAAVAAGADIIVVGRPITAAGDPSAAAAAIKEELGPRGVSP